MIFPLCPNLEFITIPRSVTQIQGSAFEDCKKLVITIEDSNGYNNIVFSGRVAFKDVKKIRVSASSLNNFKTRVRPSRFLDSWANYASIMEGF